MTQQICDGPLGDVATKLLHEDDQVKIWEMALAPGEQTARRVVGERTTQFGGGGGASEIGARGRGATPAEQLGGAGNGQAGRRFRRCRWQSRR